MEGKNLTLYTVESDSTRGAYYEVKFFEDGTVWCNCPARRFSAGAPCKHIDRLRSRGAGYKVPSRVKVFEVSHGDDSLTVVDPSSETFGELVNELAAGRELVVKRIA